MTTTPVALATPKQRFSYFAKAAHVPRLTAGLNVDGWLRNFSAQDLPAAGSLLTQLEFLVDDATRQTLRAVLNEWAQRQLALPVVNSFQTSWDSLWRETLVSAFALPNDPAASGHQVARWTREIAALPDYQMIALQDLPSTAATSTAHRVLLVDDFIGTGDQANAVLDELADPASGIDLKTELTGTGRRATLLSVVCTAWGRDVVEAKHGDWVDLCCGYLMDDSYRIFTRAEIDDPGTNSLAALAHSTREQYGASDQAGSRSFWGGYDRQALTLNFQHAAIDASLPIFTHSAPGWTPLWTPNQ